MEKTSKRQLSVQVLLDWSERRKVLEFINANLEILMADKGLETTTYRDLKRAIYQAWYSLIIAHHFKLNNYVRKVLVDAILLTANNTRDSKTLEEVLTSQDIYHNKYNLQAILSLIANSNNANYEAIFYGRNAQKNELYLLLLSIINDVNILTEDNITMDDERFNFNISRRMLAFKDYTITHDLVSEGIYLRNFDTPNQELMTK